MNLKYLTKKVATKKMAVSVAVFIAIFITHFLAFVYPNDYRIEQDPNNPYQTDKLPTIEAEAFPGNWPILKVDLTPAEYSQFIDELKEKSHHRISKVPDRSKNYFSNYSIGNYPEYLENRKGIAIKSGSGIHFWPEKSGAFRIEFGAASILESASIEIFVNDKKLSTIELPKNRRPLDSNSFIQRNFLQYWNVHQENGYRNWVDSSLQVSLSKGDEVKIGCVSNGGHCFLARPKFYSEITSKKKNFLVIVIDTLRSDAVTKNEMPYLDAFKKAGIDFSKTVAIGNMTSPSTNALLSCRRPSNLGSLAFAYGASRSSRQTYYESKKHSFPEVFQKNGWKTAMIGNISIISETLGAGVDHGFDQQIAIERDAYDTPKTTREAVKWLKENGNQQFFLYIHYHAPHAPYRAPLRDIISAYNSIDDFTSMPKLLKWLYRAETRYADRYLEILLENVKKLALMENTNIVISSDHGDQHKIRTFENNDAGSPSRGAFFDHGATLLNDEIQIPLFFRGPNFVGGKKFEHYVSNLDIGPTLLESANLKIPKWCNGNSLYPSILGANEPEITTNIVGIEGFRRRGIIFENRYKYTISYSTTKKNLFHESGYGKEKFELFEKEILIDLKHDPDEANNLIEIDSNLAIRTRKIFDIHYGTKYLWEVVIETPNGEPVDIEIYDDNLPLKYQGLTPEVFNSTKRFHIRGSMRSILTFDRPLSSEPKITLLSKSESENKFDEIEDLPLRRTYAKLNIHSYDENLPVEYVGERALMPVESVPNAYYRKVEWVDSQERKIIAGNPHFEKILRDWGYLNDK